MVSIDTIQQGLAQYLNEELVPKMSGPQRWVFGAAAELYLSNAAGIFKKLKDHPMVVALDVVDDNDQINIDKLYKVFAGQAEKSSMTVDLPFGGSFTFDKNDIDKLYKYITGGTPA